MKSFSLNLKSLCINYKGLFLLFILLNLLTESHAQQVVSSLTLVNAATDTDIRTLYKQDTINLDQTGSLLSIRANCSTAGTSSTTVGSVVFSLDGNTKYTIENEAPYALLGNKGGDYNNWTPAIGTHQLTATPYTASGGTGTKGTALSITLVVISQVDKGANTTVDGVTVSGELKKWHKVTLSIQGPATSEQASTNPFLNYRLNVNFTNGTKTYTVPGYFAADGKAAESGATSGNTWRVHFAPDATGTWTYTISFRSGTNIALSDDANAGSPASTLNGKTGSFSVGATDKTGRDHRGKGRLRYVGGHILQFAETGEYFVKGGLDSPENLLDYQDFDNTPSNTYRKSWSPHVQDWRSGDTTWRGGKGKGLIGALNYLSDQGMNAFSFLTLTLQGDDKNVFPYSSTSNYTRFDCSKLDQWEIVFEHADRKGLYLHFKTQETENDQLLDGGSLGTQRKLYYRELIARFAHHLALNWNLGEENTQTDQQRKDMAAYFYNHDPYRHPIVIHNYTGQEDAVFTPLLGSNSQLTGVSIQTAKSNVYGDTRNWVEKSASAGKKWVVANDEQGSATDGVSCDASYSGNRGSVADNQEQVRREVLWGNLMAGGAGVEYYFGYATGQTDLTCQDFRSRAKMYGFTRQALSFFRTYLPFQAMKAMDIASSGWVLGKAAEVYAVYLKSGGSTKLSLGISGTYSVQWYDPRKGGALQKGNVSNISGNGTNSIGNPPNNTSLDWVVLLTNTTQARQALAEKSLPEASVLRLYPNPVQEQLFLSGLDPQGPVQLKLSNGFQTYELSTDANPDGSLRTRLPQLAAGVYLLQIQSASRNEVRRIVVAR